jgi:hypothetical protein
MWLVLVKTSVACGLVTAISGCGSSDGWGENELLSVAVTKVLRKDAPDILNNSPFSQVVYYPNYKPRWEQGEPRPRCVAYPEATPTYRVSPAWPKQHPQEEELVAYDYNAISDNIGFAFSVQIRGRKAEVITDGCELTRPFNAQIVQVIAQAVRTSSTQMKMQLVEIEQRQKKIDDVLGTWKR